MSPTHELREFHQFLSGKLCEPGDLSPEEALDEWRRLHPESEGAATELEAIKEALDDVSKGDRGVPLDEFNREFRKRHKLPVAP